MPTEKFSKCGSLICNDKFLPFLLIKSSVNSTFSSVQLSRSVVSNSLQPHESQHTRPPCPSPLHPLKTVNWPLLLVSDLTL